LLKSRENVVAATDVCLVQYHLSLCITHITRNGIPRPTLAV
jgi:hypothetical protein